jgi:protein-L-isoaspartate(D-aspartate) O-methyltransferase
VSDRSGDDHNFDDLRREMVRSQLRNRGVRDQRVLDAMASVPRHEFVPAEHRDHAYDDQPIPIGEGQTISQPYMVAVMIEAMALTGSEKVLEIGAGSGYAAAVISKLAKQVFAVESHPLLAMAAQQRLTRLGFQNVSIHTGDGSAGLKEAAPFEVIAVAAAAPSVPQPLVDQLADGGRLIIPVGGGESQNLVLIQKSGGEIHSSTLNQCRFVPLVGRYGFDS